MHKISLIIFFFLPLFSFLHAQQLKIITQTGSTNPNDPVYFDTVWIGHLPDATLGIDEELGEEDLSHQPPFGNIDTRIIQRNETTPICIYNDGEEQPSVFFEENTETKVNYRPKENNSQNHIFNMQVNAIASSLCFNFESETPYGELIDKMIISRDSCEGLPAVVDSFIFVTADSFGFIPSITTPNIKYLTIFFKEDLFTNVLKSISSPTDLKAFPNPFSPTLFIEEENLQKSNITATNALGQFMPLDFFQNGTKIEINTTNWPPGAYFIQLWSNEGKLLKRGKAIKHF